MTIKQLTRVLELHGITYEIIGNKVIAEDSYSINGILHTDPIDLTGIEREKLFDWLGY